MLAYLMNKDMCFAKLNIDTYGYSLVESYVDIFPVRSDAELHKWWGSRQTPYNRDNFMDIYKYLQITDLCDFIKSTGFTSINDCFWIKTSEEQNWSSVNLYINPFNSTVADLSIGIIPSKIKIDKSIYSPEFSLGGSFPKVWRHINNELWLFKCSRLYEEKELFNSHIYSEVLCNQLCDYLGIVDYVKYSITTYKGKTMCKCKSFTDESIAFYPAVYTNQGYPSYEVLRDQFGKYELFYQMCILDCLTFNIDRHTGNFGYLVDSDFNIIGMAPIFDNNYSLLPNKCIENFTKSDFNKLHKNLLSRFNNEPFYSLALKVCKDYSKAKDILIKASSFKFNYIEGVSHKRLNILSKIIRSQAKFILSRLEV